MKKTDNVLTRRVYIKNELGLHARPAAKIAQLAKTARKKVWMINKTGEMVDAASIIDLLTLAALPGTEVTLKIEDPADASVINAIAALIDNGFGE